MSRKNRGHRQKKKSVLSQVIYYLVIVALVIGIIAVNRQQRAKRAEYKQTLISQETEVDISDLGDMMVRPSAETETETETETTKEKTKASKTPKATEKTSEETTEAQ